MWWEDESLQTVATKNLRVQSISVSPVQCVDINSYVFFGDIICHNGRNNFCK